MNSAEEVKPSTKYTLKISNKENKKCIFNIILLMKIVLRLTQYKLPHLIISSMENKQSLLKILIIFKCYWKYSNNKIANYLRAGGGDFEEISMLRSVYIENTLQRYKSSDK